MKDHLSRCAEDRLCGYPRHKAGLVLPTRARSARTISIRGQSASACAWRSRAMLIPPARGKIHFTQPARVEFRLSSLQTDKLSAAARRLAIIANQLWLMNKTARGICKSATADLRRRFRESRFNHGSSVGRGAPAQLPAGDCAMLATVTLQASAVAMRCDAEEIAGVAQASFRRHVVRMRRMHNLSYSNRRARQTKR